MTKEDQRNMQIANCRVCLLCKNHCANCPLNWALDLLDIEKTLKVIEIPLNHLEYKLKTSPAFAEVYDPR